MKLFCLLLTVVTGGLLFFGAVDLPDFGDAASPVNTHVSTRYIENAVAETGVPNLVTAVLADYRAFGTLGELVVVFAAAVSVLLILRKQPDEGAEQK